MLFFFKQKTAYEMRISDWSSDVCSSDLAEDPDREVVLARAVKAQVALARIGRDAVLVEEARHRAGIVGVQLQRHRRVCVRCAVEHRPDQARVEPDEELQRPQCRIEAQAQRSEERRVGNECGRTGRTRWWAINKKKKT